MASVSDTERENVTDTESDSDSSGGECLETEIVTDFAEMIDSDVTL